MSSILALLVRLSWRLELGQRIVGGLQIGKPKFPIWLQMGAFSPFVPRVDEDNFLVRRVFRSRERLTAKM